MKRHPPRATRTDTLDPDQALFRSHTGRSRPPRREQEVPNVPTWIDRPPSLGPETGAACCPAAAFSLHLNEIISVQRPENKALPAGSGGLGRQPLEAQQAVGVPTEAYPLQGRAVAGADRKSVVSGKRVSVSVDLGGRRPIKK